MKIQEHLLFDYISISKVSIIFLDDQLWKFEQENGKWKLKNKGDWISNDAWYLHATETEPGHTEKNPKMLLVITPGTLFKSMH